MPNALGVYSVLENLSMAVMGVAGSLGERIVVVLLNLLTL